MSRYTEFLFFVNYIICALFWGILWPTIPIQAITVLRLQFTLYLTESLTTVHEKTEFISNGFLVGKAA